MDQAVRKTRYSKSFENRKSDLKNAKKYLRSLGTKVEDNAQKDARVSFWSLANQDVEETDSDPCDKPPLTIFLPSPQLIRQLIEVVAHFGNEYTVPTLANKLGC